MSCDPTERILRSSDAYVVTASIPARIPPNKRRRRVRFMPVFPQVLAATITC